MAVIYQLSDSIISPFGFTSEQNFVSVVQGKSAVKFHPAGSMNVPEEFMASAFDPETLNTAFTEIENPQNLSRFEKLAILSVLKALKNTKIKASEKDCLIVLSTTKGNVDLLADHNSSESKYLWHSARKIQEYFGNPNKVIVVSNACISGVSAQIVAKKFLSSSLYKNVIVVGVDELSKFIISGFQSFKALSTSECKPFDAARTGLNLGEAAGTIIYSKCESEKELPQGTILLQSGFITNDANHISGPSRTGEGLYQAISKTLNSSNGIFPDFISAHGTATPFNDEMESFAFERCRLSTVPVNSLKAYFGHTLGAAGLIETIISSHALRKNILVQSRGFDEIGVSNPLNLIKETKEVKLHSFLKTVSGFGGCNAAILVKKV